MAAGPGKGCQPSFLVATAISSVNSVPCSAGIGYSRVRGPSKILPRSSYLVAAFFRFAIEPREWLGNPQFLLSHQHRHLLVSLGLNPNAICIEPLFSDECKKILLEKTRIQEGCYPDEFLTSTLRISSDEGSLSVQPPSGRKNRAACKASGILLRGPREPGFHGAAPAGGGPHGGGAPHFAMGAPHGGGASHGGAGPGIVTVMGGVQRVGKVEPCFMRRQPRLAAGRLLQF